MIDAKLKKKLKSDILENIKVKKKIINYSKIIGEVIEIIYSTINNGNKVFICGNGGSAADAQHLSAEFLVRLKPTNNRKPYPLISLALDTSTITACGNDYGFEHLFSRNLSALANKNDLLIIMSTSGNSKNIIKVLNMAKKINVKSVGFLGNNGGIAKAKVDIPLIVPSKNVARIQETHIFLGHFILEQVEKLLLKKKI